MNKRVVLFPWKMGSGTGKALANAVGIRRIYPDKNYSPRSTDIIINWGNSQKPLWWQAVVDRGTTIINHPDAVVKATNKLTAFKALKAAGVRIPDFTESKEEAFQWIVNDGPIVVRKILNGHSAAGLIVATEADNIGEIPSAPLYTRYVKKKDEYRVHVFAGNIIDVSKKRLRNGLLKTADYKVRNYKGGWIYARDNIDPPADVISQAQQAVLALGLDFGAVDVGWNEHHKQALVYEINSAPGLIGTTLYRYSANIVANYPGLSLHLEEPAQNFEGFDEFDPNEFVDE
ncbi:MAG: hypothetical protein H6961_10705 [Chromatiaceae bacterium]|nr:hypothetical protein [Chromatiaceae bacterium]